MAKTVLITGASGGIGRATAEIFARKGWNVAATSRRADKNLFAGIPNVRAYTLDVTDTSSIDKAFAKVIKDFGGIDAVVNNAGYGLDGIFETLSEEQIQKQFDTNVFGLMNVTRAAIQHMRPKRRGTIIQVSSMGGRLAFPLYSAYHASKWAVEGFSEALQYELQQVGLRVKIIEPGVIKTEFYGRSRDHNHASDKLGYGSYANRVESVSQRAGGRGRPPEQVAKTIFKAAADNTHKFRYVVGAPAPVLFALRKILPERIFFALVRSQYRR